MHITSSSQRLLIRPLSERDGAFILELLNTGGWIKYIGDRNVKNMEDAQHYILKIMGNSKYFYHVLELKESAEPIGVLTFLYRDTQEFPDIGFALLPQFEKKGYVFEAASRYLEEIRKTNPPEKIIGITIPDNHNSVRLLEKLGLAYQEQFVSDGTTLSLYSLTMKTAQQKDIPVH